MLAFADAPRPYQISFQDPASPTMASIISLHHEISYILLLTLCLVSYLLLRLLYASQTTTGSYYFTEHTYLDLL